MKEIKGVIMFSPEAGLSGDSLGINWHSQGSKPALGSRKMRSFSRRPIQTDGRFGPWGLGRLEWCGLLTQLSTCLCMCRHRLCVGTWSGLKAWALCLQQMRTFSGEPLISSWMFSKFGVLQSSNQAFHTSCLTIQTFLVTSICYTYHYSNHTIHLVSLICLASL